MGSYSGAANEAMRDALTRVAPGTGLRAGLERIVRAKAGALVVLSNEPEVLAICSGGFLVDAPFSPQRLSELAKMDGAIILSEDGSRIARANVHLVPDPSIPTSETGTRHRTAERVARSIDVPVVTASEEMGTINVYAGGEKRQLESVSSLLDRANQALQTLERYKTRLDTALGRLNAHEIEDLVTVRDVVTVIQRGEMVRRIAEEIETMIIELGSDARLLRLQLDELYSEIDQALEVVVQDYLPPHRPVEDTMEELSRLRDDDLADAHESLATLHLGNDIGLGDSIESRGIRLLSRVATIKPSLALRIAANVGGMARLQRVSAEELAQIDGVDLDTATEIRATIQKVTEAAILNQYN